MLHMKSLPKSVVEKWFPRSKEASGLIIPPVSLRGKIRTDGYGMTVIKGKKWRKLCTYQVNADTRWEIGKYSEVEDFDGHMFHS